MPQAQVFIIKAGWRNDFFYVSLSVALNMLLSRHPRWGYLTLLYFAILFASFNIRFTQKLWVD